MSASLLSWRRAVSELYHRVCNCEQPEVGFQVWREGRDLLFAEHPDSPLEPPARATFAGLPYAPYDPAYRYTARIETDVEPARLDVPTEADQVVSMNRFGRREAG